MDKVHEFYKDKTHKYIESLVEQSIQSIKNYFWQQIKSGYESHMKEVIKKCRETLNSSFKTTSEENYDFLDKFETEAKEHAVFEIRRQFNRGIENKRSSGEYSNTNLIWRFRAQFLYEANGSRRNWVTFEEKQIRELWVHTKEDIEPVLKEFTHIDLPTVGISPSVSSIDEDSSPLLVKMEKLSDNDEI